MRNINRTLPPTATSERLQKLSEIFRKDGIEILVRDPVFEITRIGFVTPEGELNVTGRFATPGLKPQDVAEPGPAMTVAFIQHLRGQGRHPAPRHGPSGQAHRGHAGKRRQVGRPGSRVRGPGIHHARGQDPDDSPGLRARQADRKRQALPANARSTAVGVRRAGRLRERVLARPTRSAKLLNSLHARAAVMRNRIHP